MFKGYARNQYEWDNMHPPSFYDDEPEDDEEMKIQLAEDAYEMELEAEFDYVEERC